MVGVLTDGQGNLHKYFRSQRMPQGAHAHFGLPHWPGLGGFGLRAHGEGGDLEEDRRPAWPVQSDQVCKPCTAPIAAVTSAAAATDHPLEFRFMLISLRGCRPLPLRVGDRDQEHSLERGESQTH